MTEDQKESSGVELPNAMIGKFIGPGKIESVNVREEKTPGGRFIYDVTFVDGTVETYTDMVIRSVISDEQSDLTTLRSKKVREAVIPAIMGILLEANTSIEDVGYVCQSIIDTLNQSIRHAHFAKWGKQQNQGTMLDLNYAIADGIARGVDFSKVL